MKEKHLIQRTGAYLYIFVTKKGNNCCQEVVVEKRFLHLECGRICTAERAVACRAAGPLGRRFESDDAYSATVINRF